MYLMPIVYVSDVQRSLAFYRGLGLRPRPGIDPVYWAELTLGDATLALHKAADGSATGTGPAGTVDLCFLACEPLDDLVARWAAAEIAPSRGIKEEPFGRSVQVRDPDGLVIQVNEHRA
jgi:catechol 2,3-dioxygenase-like lactoylglutathione lyase family enzyme